MIVSLESIERPRAIEFAAEVIGSFLARSLWPGRCARNQNNFCDALKKLNDWA
jgi:hypothetical protein